MSLGSVVLHRFNGSEVYNVASAIMLPVESENGDLIDLWFEVETEREAVQTVSDTAKLKMHPSVEAAVTLSDLDSERLVGRVFTVPVGYDEESERQLAKLYYFDHEDLDENEIHVLERDGQVFHVRWTGTAEDVNYYDGSKPRTRVEIDARFTLRGVVDPPNA